MRDILLLARRPQDLDTQVLAAVLGLALKAGHSPLIRGLSEARFQKLLNEYFIGLALANAGGGPAEAGDDAFGPVADLLLRHRTEPSEPSAWLAYAVATALTRGSSLADGVGLNGRHLADFLHARFAPLAAAEPDDGDWKALLLQKTEQP